MGQGHLYMIPLMMIKKLYLRIILGSICVAKDNGFMSDIWKFMSNFTTTIAIVSNFIAINLFFEYSSKTYIFQSLNFTNIKQLNFVLTLFGFLVLPIMVLNYMFIFREKKCKLLIKENPKYYVKWFFTVYFLISIFTPILFLFLKIEIK